MSSEYNFTKNYGYSAISKLQKPRLLQFATKLLYDKPKQIPDLNVNLVIDKPIFLLGGEHQPYDQGKIASAVVNAMSFLIVYSLQQQKLPTYMPSRLDMYYQTRFYFNGESSVCTDEGCNISDCEYVIENLGIIPETFWKYTDDKNNKLYYSQPPFIDTLERNFILKNSLYKVNQNNLNEIKLLLTNGYPLICGMYIDPTIFISSNTTCTGIITKIPNLVSKNLVEHAVIIVGYTEDGYFLVRNSWGVNWGLGFLNLNSGIYNYDEYQGQMRGYFKIPSSYITTRNAISELYVLDNFVDTTNYVDSIQAYNFPMEDKSFIKEITTRPLITIFSTIINDQLKLKFELGYYVCEGKCYWTLYYFKLNPSKIYQLCGEMFLPNLNFIDESINLKISQQSLSVIIVDICNQSNLLSTISINLATTKMLLIKSYRYKL